MASAEVKAISVVLCKKIANTKYGDVSDACETSWRYEYMLKNMQNKMLGI